MISTNRTQKLKVEREEEKIIVKNESMKWITSMLEERIKKVGHGLGTTLAPNKFQIS